jgi:hypothetical protein
MSFALCALLTTLFCLRHDQGEHCAAAHKVVYQDYNLWVDDSEDQPEWGNRTNESIRHSAELIQQDWNRQSLQHRGETNPYGTQDGVKGYSALLRLPYFDPVTDCCLDITGRNVVFLEPFLSLS